VASACPSAPGQVQQRAASSGKAKEDLVMSLKVQNFLFSSVIQTKKTNSSNKSCSVRYEHQLNQTLSALAPKADKSSDA